MFCIVLCLKDLRNAPKHSETSFGVQCGRMVDFVAKPFSQFRYSEIVNSGQKHKFAWFYARKVCKMLRNTLKHRMGSNGVEWLISL